MINISYHLTFNIYFVYEILDSPKSEVTIQGTGTFVRLPYKLQKSFLNTEIKRDEKCNV